MKDKDLQNGDYFEFLCDVGNKSDTNEVYVKVGNDYEVDDSVSNTRILCVVYAGKLTGNDASEQPCDPQAEVSLVALGWRLRKE